MRKNKTKTAVKTADAWNSEKHKESVIPESVSDLIFVFSDKGVFLDYQTNDETTLLIPPDQFLGKNCKEVLPPALAKLTLRNIKQTLRSGKVQYSEYDLNIEAEKKYYIARYIKTNRDRVTAIVRDITDRKNFEAQSAMFRNLINRSADLIFFIDAHDGRIFDVNESACQALGYDRQELLQLRIMDVDQSLKNESDWLNRLEELKSGKTKRDGLHRRKDGSTYPVEANSNIINDGGRELIIASFRDISTQIEAEQKIKQLSKAVEQSSASIVITDIDGNIEYVNPTFCKLTGYSFEEVIGQNPRVLKSGEHSEAFYEELWQTITAGKIWRGEFYNKKKNGDYYWEFASIAPVRNEQGKITHFVAVKENITQRKALEKTLKENEEKYRLVADFTHDWEYWIDPNGNFLYSSPSCKKISGYSADDFIADSNLIFNIAYPDDLPLIKRHFSSKIAETDDLAIDFRIIDKQGRKKWLSHVCRPVYNSEGTWVGRRGSNRDITLQKQAEEELQKSENLKTVQELAGAVSHEFSQPLQSLSNYLGLLQQTPHKTEYLQKANKSLQRIADLVKNLRDITSLKKQDYLGTQILDLKSSAHKNDNRGTAKILIVDDEQEILDTMVEIIQFAGYECVGALDGFQALQFIKKTKFDLIISDISMPRMSGTVLYEKIKTIGYQCLFLFMTGYAVSEEIEQITTKADGLLHKPIDHNKLIKIIKRQLGGIK